MARLGVRTVDELVGRTDLLKVREHPVTQPGRHGGPEPLCWTTPVQKSGTGTHFDPEDVYDFQLEKTVD